MGGALGLLAVATANTISRFAADERHRVISQAPPT